MCQQQHISLCMSVNNRTQRTNPSPTAHQAAAYRPLPPALVIPAGSVSFYPSPNIRARPRPGNSRPSTHEQRKIQTKCLPNLHPVIEGNPGAEGKTAQGLPNLHPVTESHPAQTPQFLTLYPVTKDSPRSFFPPPATPKVIEQESHQYQETREHARRNVFTPAGSASLTHT